MDTTSNVKSLTFDDLVGFQNGGSTPIGPHLGLREVHFPTLKVSLLSYGFLSVLAALETIDAPVLEHYCAISSVGLLTKLKTFNIPKAKSCNFLIGFTAPVLREIDAPAMQYINAFGSGTIGYVRRINLPVLISISVLLQSVPSSLRHLILPSTLKYTNSVALANCQLSQESVDSILHQLVRLDGTDGTYRFAGSTINISGSRACTSATRTSNVVTVRFPGHPFVGTETAWISATGIPFGPYQVTAAAPRELTGCTSTVPTSSGLTVYKAGHGLVSGDLISITNHADYNGDYVVSVFSADVFTVTIPYPAGVLDGATVTTVDNVFTFTHNGSDGAVASLTVGSAPPSFSGTPVATTSVVGSGSTVTVTTPAPHGLTVGKAFTMFGSSIAAQNGSYLVASLDGTNPTTKFTYIKTAVGTSTGSPTLRIPASIAEGSLYDLHILLERSNSIAYNLPVT